MKVFKKPLLTFILGILVTCITGVFAYSYVADQISYTTNKNENIKNVDQALNDLYDKANNKSNIIESVSFTETVTGSSIQLTINVSAKDNNKILGYHIYANDSDNNYYGNISTNNVITISHLNKNTDYNVSVVVYDIYKNYMISEKKTIKTLNEPSNLIPILTSNTSAGGNAFATTTANGRSPWEAYDGIIDPTTAFGNVPGYMVTNSSNNQIGYDFGANNNKMVTRVVYYGQPKDANCRFTTFTLQYSDNGSNWINVQTFTPKNPTTYSNISDIAETFNVTVDVSPHRYWRINGTNSGHSWSGLLELQFWGF